LVEESERMGRILGEFLNFSRPVTDLSLTKMAVADMVRDVLTFHEGMASEGDVTLALVAEPTGVALRVDHRKLKQVLVNLLQNALHVSPAGSTVTVTVAQAAAGPVEIYLDDSGPGLAVSVAERVMEPGVTTKGGGTGLGLTIARAIVQQHGGQLELVNRAGGGCRASVTLPTGTAVA
jgi:signal transduction histidine kinase